MHSPGPASILAVGNPRATWWGASTPFCKVSTAGAGLCQLQSSASTSRRLALFVTMMSLLSEALSAMNAPNSTPDQRGNADGVKAMAGPQMKAHKVAQGVGERKDFGGHAAFGTTDGLALSPPFPCPVPPTGH